MDMKKLLQSINPIALVAEMLGAFGWTFAALAATKMAAGGLSLAQQSTKAGEVQMSFPALTMVSVPIVVAFTLAVLVAIFGKFSGGHFNPATTIGMWVTRKIRTLPAALYIGVQFLGAFAAFGAMQAFLPSAKGILFSNPEPWKMFFAELIGAFIFAVGFSAAVRQERTTLEASFMIGGSLLLGSIFASFVLGAGVLNPAVFMATVRESISDLSLGPVFGPIAGAVLGSLVYAVMEEPKMPKKLSDLKLKKPTVKLKK